MRLFIILLLLILGCSDKTYLYDHNGEQIEVYTGLDFKQKPVFGIDLSNKYLDSLPPALFQNNQLQYLNVNDNNIESIAPDLCKLMNLKILLLNGNKLKSLPSCLYDMNKLEVLSILGCGLKLDLDIVRLHNLKTLVIAGNLFSESDLNKIKAALPRCKIIYAME